MAPKTIWDWGAVSNTTTYSMPPQGNASTNGPYIIPDYNAFKTTWDSYKKELKTNLSEFDEPDYDDDGSTLDEHGNCTCPDCYSGGNMKEELSFVMYKPDAFERSLVGELMKVVDSKGMKLVGARTLVMTEQQVASHYSHHVGKNFWQDMIDFYTSGPTMACVYKGVQANNAIRQLIGSKHPTESPSGSIRGKYATSFPKNLIHGSDSAGDAACEMEHFFTHTEIQSFKKA